MITREQVADLQPGDVVRLHEDHYPQAVMAGPLHLEGVALCLGRFLIRDGNGAPGGAYTLTVVERAPRPLYVNHPRTKPVPGDVFRDADDPDAVITWDYCVDAAGNHAWRTTGGVVWILDNEREKLPDRLRLLVDGETGQVVQ